MNWLRKWRGRRRLKGGALADSLPPHDDLVALADALGLPSQWNVCAFCGTYGWKLPPHLWESCPLVSQVAEAHGMAAEANRSATIRGGIHLEELTRVIRESFPSSEEGEDE